MISGDINKDGLVDQKDVKLLQKAVLQTFQLKPDQIAAADLNQDKQITPADLEELKKIIALRITGDVNGDGLLTQDDVEVLKKAVAGKLQLGDRLIENADINLDGRIDCQDILLLQKLLDGVVADYKARLPLNNKITIQLESFVKGEYLSWFVTTQAAYEIFVTLRDDQTTYFKNSKATTAIEPPLAVGTAQYKGSNLVLEISIPQSKDIKAIPSMSQIITNTGKVVGQSFTCCGEDWTDGDYNDFYVNIVGWKKK